MSPNPWKLKHDRYRKIRHTIDECLQKELDDIKLLYKIYELRQLCIENGIHLPDSSNSVSANTIDIHTQTSCVDTTFRDEQCS
jgi:hypothetical protein